MLVALQRFYLDLHAVFQFRQVLVLALVALGIVIQHREAVKLHRGAGCLEHTVVGFNVHGNRIQQSICHLAGDKAFPDQTVQLILIRSQAGLYPFRCHVRHRRTNGFVSVLCVFLGLIISAFRRQVLCTVFSGHIVRGCLLCLCGNPQTISTHVGNQTHCPQSVDVHAFVQFLCHFHGTLGLKAQPVGSVLLEGRRDKRRCGVPLGDTLFHILHRIAGILQPFQQSICGGFVRNLRFVHPLAVHLYQLGGKHLAGRRGGEFRIDRPVFLRNKCPNLIFPIDYQTHGNRLHTTGGQSAADFFPQERAELITHQTVQNPACLLGIDQIQIDLVGIAHTCLNAAAGDLVEFHPIVGVHIQMQKLCDMP